MCYPLIFLTIVEINMIILTSKAFLPSVFLPSGPFFFAVSSVLENMMLEKGLRKFYDGFYRGAHTKQSSYHNVLSQLGDLII